MRYVAELDGIRGVAVTLVLLFHAKVPGFSGGYLGVDVFFVLSGFLITRTLDSDQAPRWAAIASFYKRRAIRLYPALLFMLATYLLVAPWSLPAGQHLVDVLIASFYLSDYTSALVGRPVALSHTWSLAVEVHFYILWPLALACMASLRYCRRVWLVLLLFVGATAWRWYVASTLGEWTQPYYRFDTRLSGLLAGAFIGLHDWKGSRFAGAAGAVTIGVAVAGSSWGNQYGLTAYMLLAEIGTALAIVSAHKLGFFANRLLVAVGQLSYGIYLWHYPVVHWARAEGLTWLATFTLSAVISAAFAWFSFHYLEANVVRRPDLGVRG